MIPFIDLAAQQHHIREEIDERIKTVLDHGKYIMGPEVFELEEALAERAQVKHVISCSSGTDALILAMISLGVKPGQGVIVPSFTFAASAEAIAVLGGVPVFAEVDAVSFNIDCDKLTHAVSAAEKNNIEIVGIMAVGLFGQPAELTRLNTFAAEYGFWVLDDAAQSFGADLNGNPVGSLADITATSFFPAKPLGCYGDGGAVFTDDDSFAAIARSARVHGQGEDKYENTQIGMTARCDTIQAAILLAKLKIFDNELDLRQQCADNYNRLLDGYVTTPQLNPGASSSWAQYVILLPQEVDRQAFQQQLAAQQVPTAIYYPRPMHTQPPYAHYPLSSCGLEVTERLAKHVLALPMHPYLDKQTQETVANAVKEALKT